MRSRLRFALATLVAFLLLTLWWTWPLAQMLETSYLQAGPNPTLYQRADAMLTSWVLAWTSHAFRTAPLALFDANIFHPLPWTLAFSENLIAGALLVLPADLVWRSPVLDHNLLLLASFVLGGTGTALLVRALGGGVPAAWLAGAIVAFDPFRFGAIGHVHTNSTHWMPFALLALERCWRTGRGAILVAVSVVLVTLSSVYYAYFFVVALAVLVPAQWAFRCPTAPGGRWRAVAGIGGAMLVTGLVLLPYPIARETYSLARGSAEALFFGGKALSYLGAVVDPLDYVTRRYVEDESLPIVIGLGTFCFLLVGLATGAPAFRGGRRVTTTYGLVALVLALVSLGPVMQWRDLREPGVPGPWAILAAVVPGFAALRVPMRACTVVVLAVAVVAGLGADALWRRAHGRLARGAVMVLLVVVGLLESWRPPFATIMVPWATTGTPPVYRWLAAQPGAGAVVEIPFGLPPNDAAYMVLSAAHWRPLLNGYSGFAPTGSYYRDLVFHFPSPETLRGLQAIGVRWVVLHPHDMILEPQRTLCEDPPERMSPHLRLVYRDGRSCVFELRAAPPAAPLPFDQSVALDDATVSSSTGESAAAALDGRLDTHWMAAVDRRTETWLQIDLPAPRAISRLVVQLGSHFGEYLRVWRVDTSLDGVTWTTAATEWTAVPPTAAMRADPSRLSSEMRLPRPTPARHVRLVRPGSADTKVSDLWPNWTRWGVHEIELFADPVARGDLGPGKFLLPSGTATVP